MDCFTESAQVAVVAIQSLSRVRLSVTPWTAARQASLPFAIPWSLLKLTSIESEVPSNHLVLCRPLLLPPSVFPGVRVFSSESALLIRWPKDWRFSFSWRLCVQGFVASAVTVSSPFYWWVGWVAERPGRLPRPSLLLFPWGDWNAATRVQCRGTWPLPPRALQGKTQVIQSKNWPLFCLFIVLLWLLNPFPRIYSAPPSYKKFPHICKTISRLCFIPR